MHLDLDVCHSALRARDARFDGRFYVAVKTTGIYCRPICPARTPRVDRCDFFHHAAAAERAGYRPCLRCRPELAPGHASVDAGDRLARAALARIEGGALDAMSLDALAAELGVSGRHLRRSVEAVSGASPMALALTRRLHAAKRLLADTELPIAVIADTAGFGSARRLHAAFASRYGLAPSRMRRGSAAPSAAAAAAATDTSDATELHDDGFLLRLGYRPPLAWPELLAFLTGRGAEHVEAAIDGAYCRTLRLGSYTGWLAARPDVARSQMLVRVSTSLLPALAELSALLRRTLDLDAQPAAIAEHFASDARLSALVALRPGLRVPGAFDGFELALRTILGQQVSVKAATTLFGRFATAFGKPVVTPWPTLDRLAPTAPRIAAASLQQVIDIGLPSRRAATVLAVARACADGTLRLDPHADAQASHAALLAIPGIGPWTANYVAMRAFRDPDAFPSGDLALLKAMGVTRFADLDALAASWRPWRAYATMHVWHGYMANSGG